MRLHLTHSHTAMVEPKMGLSLILLSVALHSVLAQNGAVRLSSGAERTALIDLRSSLGLRGKDWPIKSEPCSWRGVTCGSSGRVSGINVSGLRRTRVGRASPRFAVDSLANLTGLVYFNASGFSLPGSVPEWFGQSLGELQVLDLRSAWVEGSIPASLGGLRSLRFLYLSGNNLTGNVPSTLEMLLGLSVLDLSLNFLTGPIPPEFASLGNLTRLDLSGNFLSGSVPPGLGGLSRLESLNLSDNSLSGSLPGQLGGLAQLVELDLSKNSFSGSVAVELGGLRSLRKMVIGYNGLEGPLPGGLFSSLAQLEVLVLSGNKLDGALPDVLWSMAKLSLVDVSGNNFTGVLPNLRSYSNASGAGFNLSNNMFFGTLTFPPEKFRFIDLSGNYFQGKVSDDGLNGTALEQNCLQTVVNQRSLVDCRLFYEQRDLSFDNFGVQEPEPAPPSEQHGSKKRRRLIFILVGLFGGIGFIFLLVLILVLVWKMCNKGRANQRSTANVGPVPEESPTLPKDLKIISGLGESYTYGQLLLATSGFSESNLIKHGHSGNLYRGLLEGGIHVVIKNVDLNYVKKDSEMVELELFSKVSHARLVPLLGHCLDQSEKLLVYKYMPNGDLANSFFRVANPEDNSLRSLDWITRLKIAIGAAEGLSYLHHECTPSIVHRDVQASSILLDDKFEVRLGSLSEVHSQQDSHQNVLTRLLSKPQTSDIGPSAGALSVTCPYDVYCFGKVLLELVTGKIGISKLDDSATREWLDQTLPYISVYDKELVTKIVDPSLIVDEDLLDEVWAMAIVAKSCLNPKPSRRPLMRYIVKALENPLKVVRDDNSHSARLRTTSSRRSWSAAIFGSWRQSSSESANVLGQTGRDVLGGLRQPGRIGSQGSGGIEHSSSNKRLSSEIFPEPVEMQDIVRQVEY